MKKINCTGFYILLGGKMGYWYAWELVDEIKELGINAYVLTKRQLLKKC